MLCILRFCIQPPCACIHLKMRPAVYGTSSPERASVITAELPVVYE